MSKCLRFVAQVLVLLATCSASAGSYEDFFRAVALDNDRAVRSLLERGFDPNTIGERGEVPLSMALKEGSPKVAAVLAAHPAIWIDLPNADGETPLMIAALTGRLDWVDRLLERGARIDLPGWTPLHYAASGPEPAVVRRLVERGADLEARAPNGTTPLMMASGYGDQRSAQFLLSRGAHAGARNQRGLSAADFAQMAGRDALAAEIARSASGAR